MATPIEDLQAEAIEFRNERDWEQFHGLRNLATGLSVEAAELLELFLWQKDGDEAEKRGDPDWMRRLAHEMADVQVFLLYLAEGTGISIADAVREKLRLNAEKYPVDKSKGSSAKYTEL